MKSIVSSVIVAVVCSSSVAVAASLPRWSAFQILTRLYALRQAAFPLGALELDSEVEARKNDAQNQEAGKNRPHERGEFSPSTSTSKSSSSTTSATTSTEERQRRRQHGPQQQQSEAEKRRGGELFPLVWNDTQPPALLEQVHRNMQAVMPHYRVPNRQSELHWYSVCDPVAVTQFNAELFTRYVAEFIDAAQQIAATDPGLLQQQSDEQVQDFSASALLHEVRERFAQAQQAGSLDYLDFRPATLDRLAALLDEAHQVVRRGTGEALSPPFDLLFSERLALFRAQHCDSYGPGGGMCIMQAHRHEEPHLRDRQKVLLNSNCQIWKPKPNEKQEGGMLSQLFHCPMGAPIALFVLPKSGTSSAMNYIMDLEPYIKTSLGKAMNAMLIRPKVMIDWLAEELDYWGHMENNPVVQDLSQRLMHRFPPDSYTQEHWTWMRFLPPAHLCPLCCTEQKWRKKVVLARNPFVRMASMFQFAWLPTQMHPAQAIKEASQSGTAPKRMGPYKDWSDFGRWLSRMLNLRAQWRELTGIGFTRDLSENFADKSAPKLCVAESTPEMLAKARAAGYAVSAELSGEKMNKAGDGDQEQVGDGDDPEPSSHQGFCVHLESEVDVSDIFHMRPFLDMVNDEVFLQVNGKLSEDEMNDFFVLHLETVQDDLLELYDVLCREYNYCELDALPKRFPKVLPASNTERAICKFDNKKVEYDNCETTWEALWTEEAVGLVREHYAFDLEFFGYSDSPDYVMPLKWL